MKLRVHKKSIHLIQKQIKIQRLEERSKDYLDRLFSHNILTYLISLAKSSPESLNISGTT